MPIHPGRRFEIQAKPRPEQAGSPGASGCGHGTRNAQLFGERAGLSARRGKELTGCKRGWYSVNFIYLTAFASINAPAPRGEFKL